MVTNTTVESVGKMDIPMKTTGHEKVRLSVWLAAKEDRKKMKPFIVFAAAKRESKALHEESRYEWMNEEFKLRRINEVIGKVSFRIRLLAWNTYEYHMTDAVMKQFYDITV